MQLEDLLVVKVNEMKDSGKLDELITNALEKSIASCLEDVTRSYSDFGKALKDKLSDALQNSLSDVTLAEYNMFVASAVKEAYEQALTVDGQEHMKEMLNDIMKPVPATITWDQLEEKIVEYWREDASEYGHGTIELEWRDQHGLHLTIKHPEYDWQSIQVTMYDHGMEATGNLFIGYLTERDDGGQDTLHARTHFNGLAGYLYKLYCRKTKIDMSRCHQPEEIYFEGD